MSASSGGGGGGGKSPIFDIATAKLDGTTVNKLGDLIEGKKAVLIVNVASKWGVTERDYTQLVQMYKDYKDKGLEILAYPCDQFGSQEPESPEWILDFVKKYNVEFPMMEKVQVFGKRQHPLYKWLRDESELKGGDMTWNFEKFLINSDGEIVKYFMTSTDPDGCRSEIDKLVAWEAFLRK